MTVMDQLEVADKLGIGKILILNEGHGLSVGEIKKYTKSEKVKKVKWTGLDNHIDTLISSAVFRGLRTKKNIFTGNISLYYVSGHDAASSFLRMKIDKVLGSINLTSLDVKRLHNANLTKEAIESVIDNLEITKMTHDHASEMLTEQKKKNSLKKKTKAIEKLVNGYGADELKEAIETIEEIMKDRW